jgi:hypothetical protein
MTEDKNLFDQQVNSNGKYIRIEDYVDHVQPYAVLCNLDSIKTIKENFPSPPPPPPRGLVAGTSPVYL